MLLFLKSHQAKPQPTVFFQAGGQVPDTTAFGLSIKFDQPGSVLHTAG